MSTVFIQAGAFQAEIAPSAFQKLPIANLRKLFKLLFRYGYENSETILQLDTILSDITAKEKSGWQTASKLFTDQYCASDD